MKNEDLEEMKTQPTTIWDFLIVVFAFILFTGGFIVIIIQTYSNANSMQAVRIATAGAVFALMSLVLTSWQLVRNRYIFLFKKYGGMVKFMTYHTKYIFSRKMRDKDKEAFSDEDDLLKWLEDVD
jgi:hypothetical protein